MPSQGELCSAKKIVQFKNYILVCFGKYCGNRSGYLYTSVFSFSNNVFRPFEKKKKKKKNTSFLKLHKYVYLLSIFAWFFINLFRNRVKDLTKTFNL